MAFLKKNQVPYQGVLLSFVFLMLLPGLVEGHFWANRIFDLSFFSILIFGAYAAKANKRIFTLLIGLALFAAVLRAFIWFVDEPSYGFAFLIVAGLFLIILLAEMARHVFRSNKIDANIIYGSLCIYFFFGTLFAVIYMLLAAINGSSFSFPLEIIAGPGGEEITQNLKTFFYFSFVTQTTLGYGDITPVLPLAKNLAILQAITGQMYIAILVARLIGLYLVQKK
ncbi:MAG: ion channel [Sphingomonadales bacterium]